MIKDGWLIWWEWTMKLHSGDYARVLDLGSDGLEPRDKMKILLDGYEYKVKEK